MADRSYTIGFVLYQVNPSIIGLLMLSPYHILHGQIWRLITWVFMPTDTNLVYLLIMALFYYQLGTTLERTWGTFRFNVYIFGGMLFTVIGAFLLYGIMYLMNGGVTTEMLLIGTSFSTSYINMSIFLAFACMYPDMQVLLMFIIPIKMKWMAAVYGVLIALSFLRPDGREEWRFYVAPQLYYFLLLHQKPQALYAARGAQTPEV